MGAVSFSIDKDLVVLLGSVLGLRVSVETGTFKGDTIATMLPLFERLHSVELSDEYFHVCKNGSLKLVNSVWHVANLPAFCGN
jgi:hypothetical protein